MTPMTRWGGAFLALLAALFAALLAHIGIDFCGDYLLPHDTYDDIAHGSRTALSCTALVAIAILALHTLSRALDEARGPRTRPAGVHRPARRSFWVFSASVIALTLVLLAAMECADLRAAGRPLEDVADLLGGSLWLGLGLTLPFSASVAWAAWRIAGWAAKARAVAVRVAGALLLERARRGQPIRVSMRYALRPPALEAILARRFPKRGPPNHRL